MVLPDERKAASASSLIQQFQARIQSQGEAPLVPVAPFASPAKPRPSPSKNLKQFSDSPGLGNDNTDLKRMAEQRAKQLDNKAVSELIIIRSAGLPASSSRGQDAQEIPARSTGTIAMEGTKSGVDDKSATDALDSSNPAPSHPPSPPIPVVSQQVDSRSPEPEVPALATTSPPVELVDTVSDDSRPPSSTAPISAPRSPPLVAIESTSPSSLAKSRSSSSASTGPAGPTASSIAKSRPPRVDSPVSRSESTQPPTQRISTSVTPSSPVAVSTPSQSPVISRGNGRSDSASPTRSRRGSPVVFSSSLGTDGFDKARSNSSTSTNGKRSPAVSSGSGTGGGAGPRKVVPTTGTPRSRAAAAAALAAQSPSTSPVMNNSPAKSPVVKKPSSLVKAPAKNVSTPSDDPQGGENSTPPRMSRGLGRVGLAGAGKVSNSSTSSPHSSPRQANTSSPNSSPTLTRSVSKYDEDDPITEHSPSLNFRTSTSVPPSPTLRSPERLSPRFRAEATAGEQTGPNEAFNFKGFAGRILPEVESGVKAGASEQQFGLGIAASPEADDLPEIE